MVPQYFGMAGASRGGQVFLPPIPVSKLEKADDKQQQQPAKTSSTSGAKDSPAASTGGLFSSLVRKLTTPQSELDLAQMSSMFPDMDRDLLEQVYAANERDLDKTVHVLLEMNDPSFAEELQQQDQGKQEARNDDDDDKEEEGSGRVRAQLLPVPRSSSPASSVASSSSVAATSAKRSDADSAISLARTQTPRPATEFTQSSTRPMSFGGIPLSPSIRIPAVRPHPLQRTSSFANDDASSVRSNSSSIGGDSTLASRISQMFGDDDFALDLRKELGVNLQGYDRPEFFVDEEMIREKLRAVSQNTKQKLRSMYSTFRLKLEDETESLSAKIRYGSLPSTLDNATSVFSPSQPAPVSMSTTAGRRDSVDDAPLDQRSKFAPRHVPPPLMLHKHTRVHSISAGSPSMPSPAPSSAYSFHSASQSLVGSPALSSPFVIADSDDEDDEDRTASTTNSSNAAPAIGLALQRSNTLDSVHSAASSVASSTSPVASSTSRQHHPPPRRLVGSSPF
ncbi:hypothetical protein RI367_003678 [Sorochytrium milnesiophthora]